MATAAKLFTHATTPRRLVGSAARMLASEPGNVCVISLVSEHDQHLRPVRVAHTRSADTRELRRALEQPRHVASNVVDAFSRAVQRSGRSLRMAIGEVWVARLWLPEPYWAHLERHGITSVLGAPLRTPAGSLLGTLVVWRERDQPAYTGADEAFLNALAGRLALGIAT
jgi:GAF domain-containing protein